MSAEQPLNAWAEFLIAIATVSVAATWLGVMVFLFGGAGVWVGFGWMAWFIGNLMTDAAYPEQPSIFSEVFTYVMLIVFAIGGPLMFAAVLLSDLPKKRPRT